MSKVIISCALTGAVTTKKHCPAIPYTPIEIADEAKRAYDAGAAVVHIHARNDDGSPTFSPAVFAKIKEEVQKRCPIILNFSTGTILEDVTEQCTYIRESRPAVAALNMGTMNYSKYSAKRKAFDLAMSPFGKYRLSSSPTRILPPSTSAPASIRHWHFEIPMTSHSLPGGMIFVWS
jgi:uncharacterized protein (DUF849 family)